MKTICILKSELDGSIYVCSDADLESFNRHKNKEISIASAVKIRPWAFVGRFEFHISQAADEFANFLHTDEGRDFADKYLLLNPLSELKKLMAVLPKSCRFYVMGGLALDGHNGCVSRRHDDLDLVCWRKDVNIFRKALKKIGYKVRERYAKEDPHLLRLLETDEESPAIEVKIIDEQSNGCFQFHVNAPGVSIFPKKLLGPRYVSLEGLKFPAITLPLIAKLNELNRQNLKRIKKENPQLYKVLGYKIDNVESDGKIIKKLLKQQVTRT